MAELQHDDDQEFLLDGIVNGFQSLSTVSLGIGGPSLQVIFGCSIHLTFLPPTMVCGTPSVYWSSYISLCLIWPHCNASSLPKPHLGL